MVTRLVNSMGICIHGNRRSVCIVDRCVHGDYRSVSTVGRCFHGDYRDYRSAS